MRKRSGSDGDVVRPDHQAVGMVEAVVGVEIGIVQELRARRSALTPRNAHSIFMSTSRRGFTRLTTSSPPRRGGNGKIGRAPPPGGARTAACRDGGKQAIAIRFHRTAGLPRCS